MVKTRSMARRGEWELSMAICSASKKKLLPRTRKRLSFQLPFDLIVEILARLPVKSLIRFKLVCKTWYALIESPTFVDKHHITGPVITSILKLSSNGQFCINDEGFYKTINFDSLILPNRCICLLGICDGLVCARFAIDDSDYIIGNPATREFRRTSQSKLPTTWDDLVFFGFSSFSNEYKLVRVIYRVSSTGEVVLKAEVYTMSTDIWVEIDVKMARVESVVHLIEYDCWYSAATPVVLNGIFYWEAATSIDMCIVSFDISSGLFDQIYVPIRLETLEAEDDCWRIIEYKEELSFIISHSNRTFELWVLDGNKSSWTQKLSIDSITPMLSPVEYDENVIAVAGFTRSEEILIEDWYNGCIKKMLLYDLNSRETKSLSYIEVNNFDLFYIYIETLRSAKPRIDIVEAV